MVERVAVVYLARSAHGINAFAPFVESYKKFPPEFPHDLILIGKGMTKAGERAATAALFSGIPHTLEVIPDDGMDIHAYLRMAKILPHEYVLFCNTYTHFLGAGWLRKMMAAADMPRVGLVGASGSYESLVSSNKILSKAVWLVASSQVAYQPQMATQFESALNYHAPAWMTAHKSPYRRLRRVVGDVTKNRPAFDDPALAEKFEEAWQSYLKPGGPYGAFADVDEFPNAHVRSNVFLINRERLLAFDFQLDDTKAACSLFESGREGLPRRIEAAGLRQVIVGRDGRVFDVADWPKSGTFRLDNQENLLAADNQTSRYHEFSAAERELHQRMTWGDYLAPERSGHLSLGVSFAVGSLPLADGRPASEDAPKREQVMPVVDPVPALPGTVGSAKAERLISIVIPTHNRLDLVKEAIETVRRQSRTDGWELIVFDNASNEPVCSYVEGLNDPRVSAFRSEAFLPVTDSWNMAFAAAKGDYVTFLGDDDGLAPQFFDRVEALIDSYDNPDVIYSSLYQFFHPGVAPWQPAGSVSDVRNGFFFKGRDEPFLLSVDDRRRAVEGSLSIRRNFTFNMQCFVFSRALIDKVSVDGKFFFSPFPDYFTANVVFAMAEKVLVVPTPLAIQGVSRASFGFTLFNNLEAAGSAMLNTDLEKDAVFKRVRDRFLPGPMYLTKYILTMQHVVDKIGPLAPRQVDYDRYRRMQVLFFVQSVAHGMAWVQSEAGKSLWSQLTAREKLWAAMMSYAPRTSRSARANSLFQKTVKELDPTGVTAIVKLLNVGDFTNLPDVYDALEDGSLTSNGAQEDVKPVRKKAVTSRPARRRVSHPLVTALQPRQHSRTFRKRARVKPRVRRVDQNGQSDS